MSNLVTTAELAVVLKVSPGTIRDAVKQGRLQPIRLSRKVMRFDLAKVQNQLTQSTPAIAK